MALTAIIGIVMAALVVVVALVGLRRWEAERGRSRQLRAIAKDADYSYFETNDGVVGKQRFDVFTEGSSIEATHIVRGHLPDGRRPVAFDYQLVAEYELYRGSDGQTHRRRKGETNAIGGKAIGIEVDQLDKRGSASLMKVDAFFKNVLVQPRGWPMSSASRLPDAEPDGDRPEQFAALYVVRTDDPEFARQFLTPKMMKFIAATGGRLGFEIRGANGIVFAPEVKPEDMIDLAKIACMWADLIDPDLLAAYATVEDKNGNHKFVADRNQFPSVDTPASATGPVLPGHTPSSHSVDVPVVSSSPQLPPPVPPVPPPPPAPAPNPNVAAPQASSVDSESSTIDWSL